MKNLGFYLEKLSLILLSLLFLAFPFVFTTLTSDSYILPKEAILTGVVLLVFILLSVKGIAEKGVKLRRTPLDGPLLLFTLVVFLSSILAVNRADSLISFAPLLFSVLLYFAAVNTVKDRQSLNVLLMSYLLGAVLLSLLSVLLYFKIYLLPFDIAKNQTFSPLGSVFDQTLYLFVAVLTSAYFVNRMRGGKKFKFSKFFEDLGTRGIITLVMLLVTAVGLIVSTYLLVKFQRPTILPFDTGFQTAFAAISQDTGRMIQAFLLGSGFGTYSTDFTRFKIAAFNQTPYWSLTFFKSSSFILELLATTGVLGLASFLFLAVKILKQKPFFWPLAFWFVLALILPLSFVPLSLLFILLSFMSISNGIENTKKYYDVELGLVALTSGLVAVSPNERREIKHGYSKLLPGIFFLIVLLIAGVLGLFSTNFVLANAAFQRSLLAQAQQKGNETYQEQLTAINLFGFSDSYHVAFSQTNMALASSLIKSQPKGASPSAQTQQTIYSLIQQAINYGRSAVNISPQTAVDWQNLSGIYRNLIGFGKNADSFAVTAQQQAIALDPTNPNEYMNFGQLYYQLGLWDKAEEQFRIAINLKPDFGNAYYNLAHTFEQKGDMKSALDQLQIVKSLVKNDPSNLKKVEGEIDDLNKGLTASNSQTGALPAQYPPVAIPAPLTPKPTPTPTPLATQQPLGSPTPSPTPVK